MHQDLLIGLRCLPGCGLVRRGSGSERPGINVKTLRCAFTDLCVRRERMQSKDKQNRGEVEGRAHVPIRKGEDDCGWGVGNLQDGVRRLAASGSVARRQTVDKPYL